MNCPDVRARLPALAYDGLSPAEREPLDKHLAACPSCRKELDELRQVRRLLAAVPAPAVPVDLPALYRRAAELQARRLRRWRRLAVASSAAAAVLFLLFGLGLEVRVEAHQVVLRWGTPPAATPDAPAPDHQAQVPPEQPPPAPAVTADQVRTLQQLVQALAEDAQERDYRTQQQVDQLQASLRQFQQQQALRCGAVERDVAALYSAQFPTRKGTNP
jgi:hypothetical protein